MPSTCSMHCFPATKKTTVAGPRSAASLRPLKGQSHKDQWSQCLLNTQWHQSLPELCNHGCS